MTITRKTRRILSYVVIALAGIAVVSIAVLALARGHFRGGTSSTQVSFSEKKCLDEKGRIMSNDDGRLQYRCIDRKALLAQSGDPQSVRDLADAVVEFNGTAETPEAVLNEFEERLTNSELKYRIRALNNLAQKLNAPDYARTYSGEVKLLRANSRLEMPHFTSPEGSTMSPLEAAYVLHLLIYQKVFNETFLLTPEERAALERQPATTRTPIYSNQLRTVTVHPRVKEMMTVARKAGAMRIPDLIEMGQHLLDDLGIQR